MTASTRRPPKTVADYEALPDDVRAELIRGELYVTPSPLLPHQGVVENLHLLLAPHVRARGLGHLHLSPLDVHLPSGDIVQPDLVFVARANDAIRQDWIRGVPDLLVEILSPSHLERDRIVKRDLYAENGVPEYWIVSPEEAGVEVFRLEDGTWRPAGWFRRGQALRSPTFPGLEVPVDRIFEDVAPRRAQESGGEGDRTPD